LIVGVDWVAVSSIATAGATLVLALATFASVRSANRAARVAERSLLAGLRPLLMPTRPEDPPQKVGFMDDVWFAVGGSRGIAEARDDNVYLALALRNVGNAIAVLHGWYVHTGELTAMMDHAALGDFRRLTRDLYIAPGEAGFWQGALRDPTEPAVADVRQAIAEPRRIGIEVLYGDHELGQRSVSLFLLTPRGEEDWFVSVARHWNIDRPDPR
jgi:hypothetical protein